VIGFTPEQATADLDLGEIQQELPVFDATIDLTALNRTYVLQTLGLEKNYFTLVKEDGSSVFYFSWTYVTNKSFIVTEPDEGIPQVSAGKYFFAPGFHAKSHSVIKLVRLLRAGRVAEVELAGVPSIQAISGQTVSAEVDV
jgi:hypothetical protein